MNALARVPGRRPRTPVKWALDRFTEEFDEIFFDGQTTGRGDLARLVERYIDLKSAIAAEAIEELRVAIIADPSLACITINGEAP